MTIWLAILLASVIVWAIKNFGFVVPGSFLRSEFMAKLADLVTVSLLAALVVLQSVGAGTSVVVDARLPALVVAGALFYFRVPFLFVLVAAGGIAAFFRLLDLFP